MKPVMNKQMNESEKGTNTIVTWLIAKTAQVRANSLSVLFFSHLPEIGHLMSKQVKSSKAPKPVVSVCSFIQCLWGFIFNVFSSFILRACRLLIQVVTALLLLLLSLIDIKVPAWLSFHHFISTSFRSVCFLILLSHPCLFFSVSR